MRKKTTQSDYKEKFELLQSLFALYLALDKGDMRKLKILKKKHNLNPLTDK